MHLQLCADTAWYPTLWPIGSDDEREREANESVQSARHDDVIKVYFLNKSGWLVGFYGISTLVSYFMPNPGNKVGDHSRGWPEGSLFDSLLHQGVGEGATPFPGLLHFTLDPYLIMLSVKQGGIKYHFLSLWSPGRLANTLFVNKLFLGNIFNQPELICLLTVR